MNNLDEIKALNDKEKGKITFPFLLESDKCVTNKSGRFRIILLLIVEIHHSGEREE